MIYVTFNLELSPDYADIQAICSVGRDPDKIRSLQESPKDQRVYISSVLIGSLGGLWQHLYIAI